MKTCKMAMAACGAVLAGVVYGCIAGFCPRGDAVICAGMMALCLAYCRASMIYRKRRRQRQEAEARRAARQSLGLACGLYEADQMKHPDWKETKVQRRMVRRIATDLAMEELYMQKKAEAKRKRQFDKLLLERWKVRQAAKNGGGGHDG